VYETPLNKELLLDRITPQVFEIPQERARTDTSKDALKRAFLDNLFYIQGKFPALATENDYYMAMAYMVRDRLLHRWVSSATEYTQQ
jgi:glycogen phosphorylase